MSSLLVALLVVGVILLYGFVLRRWYWDIVEEVSTELGAAIRELCLLVALIIIGTVLLRWRKAKK